MIFEIFVLGEFQVLSRLFWLCVKNGARESLLSLRPDFLFVFNFSFGSLELFSPLLLCFSPF